MVERPSHFFKVILPSTLEDKKLRIPVKFVRKFGDKLSAVATIRVPNGRIWQVGLIKDGENIWFFDGWHDFVEYHSIDAGYFLVFRYERNSNFHVLIFNKSACEILYPSMENETKPSFGSTLGIKRSQKFAANLDRSKLKHSSEIRIKKCKMDALNDVNQSRCKRKLDKNGKCNSQGSLHRKRHLDENPGNAAYKVSSDSSDEDNEGTRDEKKDFLTVLKDMGISITWRYRRLSEEERGRAIDIAEHLKPKNPSFMIILRSNNMKNHRLYVPRKFANVYLKEVAKCGKLQFSDGREWPVEILWRTTGCFIKNGWAEFSNDNNLEEGDICVFELIKKNFLLKVSVFHMPKK